jgi:hypothetical protein
MESSMNTQHVRRTMPFGRPMSLTPVIAGVLLASLAAAQPAPAMAKVLYPLCLHGSPLHCYYMDRWQCEESADFRGICLPNPNSGEWYR